MIGELLKQQPSVGYGEIELDGMFIIRPVDSLQHERCGLFRSFGQGDLTGQPGVDIEVVDEPISIGDVVGVGLRIILVIAIDC